MKKEKVKSRDLFYYRFPSELSCSPKGTYLAFLLTEMDEAADGYQSDLWVMEPKKGAESLRKLTASGDVRGFRWETEETLLFSSARNKPKAGTTDFYTIGLNGGEAEKAYTIPENTGIPVPLSEEKLLIRIKRTTDPKTAEPDRAAEGKDYWTFTDKPFIRNGENFGERRRMMLAVYDRKSGETAVITPNYFEVSGVSVRPDKKKILYFGEEYEDCQSLFQTLCEYDTETGETKTLIEPGKYQISMADYCEGGIFLQASTLSHSATQNHDLYFLNTETGELRRTQSPDGMFGSLIDVDVTYGAGKNHKMLGTYFIGARLSGVKTEFDEVNAKTGEIRKIAETDAFTCLDVYGDDIYAVALENYGLSEIYHIDRKSGALSKLTEFGGAYLSAHEIPKPEKLTFVSENGETVDGFVIKPADFSETGRYPGVLMIHGGPKWAYSASFTHVMQCLCAKGMFVFFCNPHGSDAYGDSFLEMVGAWGKDDYLHCTEFTDEVLKKYPQLDETRLGVTGGSYGGFMTNWIIGHTDRFKAAVSQRGICNMITENLIVDLGERLMKQEGGNETPWTNEALFWEMSPLKYVKNVKTPTLFLHSDKDYRCFPGEAMQMFTAMKQLGVPTELILFHGDNHGLSRSGRPSHRIVRVEAITDWFLRYL